MIETEFLPTVCMNSVNAQLLLRLTIMRLHEEPDLADVKRAHHYIWRHYLEAWEVDSRVCCRLDGKVKCINAVNLGVENDFYKLPDLNDAELAFVKMFAESMPAHGQKVFKGFIESFTAHSWLKTLMGSASRGSPEVRQALKAYQSNMEEEWHTAIEHSAIPILAAVRRCDISFYRDSEQATVFMYYLALQLSRTRKLRDSLVEFPNQHGINGAKVGQIIAHFGAVNLGANLYIRRQDDPITLIVNSSDMGLITGDQPVVNLYSGSERSKTELALYYPVSPTHAILLGNLDSDVPIPLWNVDNDQVRRLNRLILSQSHKMAFARSAADFEG